MQAFLRVCLFHFFCAATLCYGVMSSDVLERSDNPCENELQCPSHMICYSWRAGNYSCYCPDLLPPDPATNPLESTGCHPSRPHTDYKDVLLFKRKYYYVFHADKVDMYTAQANCLRNNGILATIPDQETLTDVQNWARSSNISPDAYIGLSREYTRYWKWSNDSTYSNFPVIQTNVCHGPCHCITWTFIQRSCYTPGSYICQHQYSCNLKDLVIPHATYIGCSTSVIVEVGHQIMFQCNDGYIQSENRPNSVTCVFPGMWDITRQDQRCVPSCNPPDIINADIPDQKPLYPMGKTITVFCKHGYFAASTQYPVTHFEITCLTGGVWKSKAARCLPFSGLQFKYHHLEIKNKILEVLMGETMQLSCDNILKTRAIARKWLKNQNDIPENYIFNPVSGALTITNISQTDEGLFTCILIDDLERIRHVEEYNLQLPNDNCTPQHSTLKEVNVKEGDSVLLSCDQPLNAEDAIWDKDGSRVWGDDHLVLLQDGSLLIEEVYYGDEGRFTCRAVSSDDGCLRENIIVVRVMVGTAAICGSLESVATTEDSERHPWFVSLWWDGDLAPFCYGSIISRSWVVTSASCVYGFQRREVIGMLVKFGNAENIDSTAIAVPVKFVRIHPQYSRRLNANDIGLIRLQRPINYDRYIRPICLPTNKHVDNVCEPPKQIHGRVPGLGSLTSQNTEDFKLAAEDMVVADKKDCRKMFGEESFSSIQDTVFCAYKKGFEKGNPENLQSNDSGLFAGDSGSPFEVDINGRWFVYGVFSSGDRSTSLGNFDYFTVVSHYNEWLQQHLRRN